jgi:hypothetical protein
MAVPTAILSTKLSLSNDSRIKTPRLNAPRPTLDQLLYSIHRGLMALSDRELTRLRWSKARGSPLGEEKRSTKFLQNSCELLLAPVPYTSREKDTCNPAFFGC